MRWLGRVACMRVTKNACSMLVGKPKEKRHLEELNIDERIHLKYVSKKWDRRSWIGCFWSL